MSTELTLDCGCTVTVSHDRGDRGRTCGCGRQWVVRAASVERVTYHVDERPTHETM